MGRRGRGHEQRCGLCNKDNAHKADQSCELLLSAESLTRDDETAEIASKDWVEKGQDGRFTQGQIQQAEIHAKYPKKARDTSCHKQPPNSAGSKGKVRHGFRVDSIRRAEEGGDGLADEEDLEWMHWFAMRPWGFE